MLDAILGTGIIKGGEQGSKRQEKLNQEDNGLFSQILNLMQNTDGKIDEKSKEENPLWALSTAQLLENSGFSGKELFNITEKNFSQAEETPFLIDKRLTQIYQKEGATWEALAEETQNVLGDYTEEQLRTDGSDQEKDLIQVMNSKEINNKEMDSKEIKIIEQNPEEAVEPEILAQKSFRGDKSSLAINKVEEDIEKLAGNGPELGATEEDADNKIQEQIVNKKANLEETEKPIQAQTSNSSDWSQNSEAQSQQLNIVNSDPKVNLEQISQDNKSTEGDNSVSPKELPKHILEQLKNNFRTSKGDNTSKVTIRLKPESLGKILLHLTTEGEKLSIRIFTESSLSKALVEQNMSLLRQSLEEQGIKSKSINVEVGGDNLSQHFNQQREHQTKENSAHFTSKNKKEYSTTKVEERSPLKLAPRKASGLSKIEILA